MVVSSALKLFSFDFSKISYSFTLNVVAEILLAEDDLELS